MARVVIVDDEKLVLYGIRSFLLEEGGTHEVTGLFTNGADALAHCRARPPDIVLTDIKMPGMDGLELISALKAELPSTKIVVLSCHDEFRLVRKAFTLGADEYLLKHETERAGLLALLETLSGHDASPASLPANGQFRDAARFFAPFPEWIPPERLAEIRAIIERYGLRLASDLLLPAVIMFRDEYTEDFRLIPWSCNRLMIGRIMQDSLDAAGLGEVFELHTAEFLCLFEFPADVRPSKHAALGDVLARVLQSIGRYCNRQVFIGVAERPVELAALGEGLLSADRALEMRFYHEKGAILFEDSIRMSLEAAGPDREARFKEVNPLRIAPEKGIPESEQAVKAYVSAIRADRPLHPRAARSMMAMTFRQDLSEVQGLTGGDVEDIASTETGDLFEILSHADSIPLFERAARSLMSRIRTFRRNARAEKSFAAAVRAFMETHYREELELTVMAESFHMTVGHFCETFKREIGSTFIDTLNELRVTKAKGVLVATDKPCKEIAAMVGYRNPNYFSRVFKRYAGCTVREFRDRSVRSENSE